MTGSVKDLIRSIRGSKTSSEERAVLAKECAKIRSSLTSDNIASRRKNITKLLFIHLLGYPTNFGQVECIKLIASNKFSDKRIGYLALNVLLTEDSEVLMLATNSIKIDLNDPNPYVCEMALRSLANIGTDEMLRELQYEIERLMNSNVPNIKKKATICTVRMLRKEANRNLTPDSVSMDLARSFLKYLGPLISDFDNGVKTAGLSLMAVFLEHYTEICNLPEFFQMLLNTMSTLLNPTNTNYSATIPSSTELFTNQSLFDEQASSDPFLKVKLLSLIKQVYHKLLSNKSQSSFDGQNGSVSKDLLGDASDFDMSLVGYKQQLYDMVSLLISTIEMGTNSNYAILYECLTAIECELSDEKFNDLGKAVVNKFIQGPTNNIKYLALGVIKKLHNLQIKQGDNIWCIILQSFKQRDLSIRMKALDVSLKIVNSQTLKPLMQYLYEFLLSVDEDLRKESLHRIFNCVNQHSEDLEYKLQVFVKIFTIAGNSVQDVILFDFIDLLASSSQELKASTTVELLKVVRYNMGQSALVKSTLYSVGEYYELLSNVKLKKVLCAYNASPVNSTSRTNNVDHMNNYNYQDKLNNLNSMDKSSGNRNNNSMDNNNSKVTHMNGTNRLNNETSLDLLLDLSSPTNRNRSLHNLESNEFDKPREDDLLLDLDGPGYTANEATELGRSPSDDDLFDLYSFDNNSKNTKNTGTNHTYNNNKNLVEFDLDFDNLDKLNNLNSMDKSSGNRLDITTTNNNNNQVNNGSGLTLNNFGERDLDDDLAVVELLENICVRLLTKNLLNECEFLITCIGKLVYKMPKGAENLRKILRKFKRHSNPELQQRACELDVLIQENMVCVINPANKGVVHSFSSTDKDLSSLYGDNDKVLLENKDNDNDNELSSLYDQKLVLNKKNDLNDKMEVMGSVGGKVERLVDEDFFNLGQSSGTDFVRDNYSNTNDKDSYYDKKNQGKSDDLFDEFFNTNTGSSNFNLNLNLNQTVNTNNTNSDLVKDLDFNTDKMANSIAENVAIVSSREKLEDDFQQFDPF